MTITSGSTCPRTPRPTSNDQVLACIGRLVGTQYVPGVKAYISELTGRERVVGPGDIATREIDPARSSIATNSGGLIEAFSFG